MARTKIDKEVRRNILDARRIIQEAQKADCNEAETRRRIERIFETLMGYDVFKHMSRERAVRGAGETEHVDFAIQLEEGETAKPIIMVEIKRVNVDLAPKHLKQVSSYAINAGCEWIILTNSRDWRLYHVSFGQPPITKLIHSWDILTDDVSVLAQRFNLVSYRNVKKGVLDEVWRKSNILSPHNLLQAILSEHSIKLLRRELRKNSGVSLSLEDIVSGIRRLLNEAALTELENVRLSLPERKPGEKQEKERNDPWTKDELLSYLRDATPYQRMLLSALIQVDREPATGKTVVFLMNEISKRRPSEGIDKKIAGGGIAGARAGLTMRRKSLKKEDMIESSWSHGERDNVYKVKEVYKPIVTDWVKDQRLWIKEEIG